MARKLEIANFPRDGLWYVRWVESLPLNDAGTVKDRLRVVLCRVRPDAASYPKIADVRSSLGTPRVPEVSIDLLPALRLGSVWQRGECVGRLLAEERAFKFELPQAFFRNAHGLHLVSATVPTWRDEKLGQPLRLLSDDYPTGAGSRSVLTVLTNGDETLLLPASEVIRVFLAPNQGILNALLAGPWSQTRFTLLDRATRLENGEWHVHLQDGASTVDALHLANMHHALNRRGFDAAKRVLTGISQGQLIGMLPFDRGTMPITARVLEVRPKTYLCLEILRLGWPRADQPPVIVHGGVIIDASIPDDDAVRRPVLAVPASVQVGLPVLPPTTSGGAVAITLPGPRWDDLPAIERRPARKVPFRVHRTRIVPSSGSERAGTGHPDGKVGHSRLAVRAGGGLPADTLEVVPRFEALRACLAALRKRKRILDWEPVHATEDAWKGQRGDLPVWAFEQKRSGNGGEIVRTWALIVEGTQARPRTMLVYRIFVDLELTLIWFELEPVVSKGSPALIFKHREGNPEPPYDLIFRWTRAQRGFRNLQRFRDIQRYDWGTYKHKYIRDPQDREAIVELDVSHLSDWFSAWLRSELPEAA